MNKHRGFTLIELIVVIAIVAIIAAVAIPAVLSGSNRNQETSWGVNGVVSTRCIAGFKHTVGEGGQPRQIINENGGGIPCTK